MSRIAFVFPGQGSQSVGMGQDFFDDSAARKVYDVFNEVVDERLSQICFEGPEDSLRRTLYTQPAILSTALAALEMFKNRLSLTPVVVAGHSLGEYGALYASRAISLNEAALLIKRRAALMELAESGAMSAVLGLSSGTVDDVLAQFQKDKPDAVIAVANYNSHQQSVISGTPEAVSEFSCILKENGAKRVIALPVGGAFHSPLMTPAAKLFEAYLNEFTFQDAEVPVISNVDAQSGQSGALLKEKLARQIDSPVCWVQSMTSMVESFQVDTVIEFGPGKVLAGLFKKSYPSVSVYNVFDLASLEATCSVFREYAVVR